MARRITGWRRLAGAAWKAPSDPQFYGDLEIDAAILQSFVEEARRRTGVHVTLTHVVGKAIAHALDEVPSLRVRLAHGREYPRESVDVFFIVADGEELTGAKISAADEKSVVDIGRELEARVAAIRAGHDEQLGQAKAMMARLPRRLLPLAIRASAYLTCELNVNLPQLGMPRQPFGSAMVTAVGGWGITHAYSPLAAYYHVPLLVLVGAVQEKPVAVAGRVVVRPMLGITATFDHRWCDGLQATQLSRSLRDYLTNPYAFEPSYGVGTTDRHDAPIASTV